MKYCARCGAELYDEAVICIKCGCPVDGMKTPYTSQKSNSYNTLAIVGFILSFLYTLVGLILSIIAYKQIKDSGEKGKGLAVAGIVISSISVAFVVLGLFIYIGLLIALI